jgi:CRP-like cAMP-binding protein
LIYFIKKGEVILYNDIKKPFKKYIVGDMFGDSDTILQEERDGTAVVAKATTLLVINKEELTKLFL